MVAPVLIRVEVRSSAGEPHPVAIEPSAGGWHEWPVPIGGWEQRARAARTAIDERIEQITAEVDDRNVYMRAVFATTPGERFWGFGERSHATEHSGSVIEHWVGEGPYQLEEYPIIEAITPRWAIRRRRDATYYPIPWLLSSRGYGVLTDSPEWSCHDLTDPRSWSVIALTNRLQLRVFSGTGTADALRLFTLATGRQPHPARWFFGPWVQTGHANLVPLEEERAILDALRAANAPVSGVETHMRRLPGGAHLDFLTAERERTAEFHRRGLASLTYLSPSISIDFTEAFEEGVEKRAFVRGSDSKPYTYSGYIGGRDTPIAVQAQLDFSDEPGRALFARFIEEVFEDGHDGWMEDFGEYTPLDSLDAGGMTGGTVHNLYPLRYHAAAARIAASRSSEPARFVRSGWTGSAVHSPLVWGGDPTTGWGFDGLRSAVIQGLSMGMSGVAFWGSDIGGFFSLGDERLTPELLIRWIQFGALSPLMRTKAGGVAIGDGRRPQVWEPDVIAHWRRWASFHTRLSPYLMEAAAEHGRTGMPIMRHHALTDPDDLALIVLEDQYRFGPDLLVAPVLEPAAHERTVRLPAGEWIDLWRSVAVLDDGAIIRHKPIALAGSRTHLIPAPIDEIPVFIRADARIPLLPTTVLSLYEPLDHELEIFGWDSSD